MTKVIYKYQLSPKSGVPGYLEMPAGAQVLSAHMQYGAISIWAIVEPTVPKVRYPYFILGTGESFDPTLLVGSSFINTILMFEGTLVWHIFIGNAQS